MQIARFFGWPLSLSFLDRFFDVSGSQSAINQLIAPLGARKIAGQFLTHRCSINVSRILAAIVMSLAHGWGRQRLVFSPTLRNWWSAVESPRRCEHRSITAPISEKIEYLNRRMKLCP